MDNYVLILHVAVFAASFLQAATGIGFGLLAGPIILIVTNNGSAIQVSILLSLLIALVLAPSLFGRTDKVLLKHLLIGTVPGLPLGIAVFLLVGVDMLKLLAGLAVLFMALITTGVLKFSSKDGAPATGRVNGRAKDLAVGVVSGAMCSSLGMPGPVVAARMMVLDQGKDSLRATVLVMFVFSYLAAIAVQAAMVGLDGDGLTLTAILAPATLIGVFCGKFAVEWISERAFRRIISVMLLATAASLLFVSGRSLLFS